MKVSTVIQNIKYKTNTTDQLAGRASNNLFSNTNICNQLNLTLYKYSAKTEAIEGIYSTQLSSNQQSLAMPTDMIRANSFQAFSVSINAIQYMLNMGQMQSAITYYNYQIPQGIPMWAVPWNTTLYIYPANSQTYNTTNLSAAISDTDTTIPVDSTSNFLNYNGRFTIGDEKISFTYKDATNFYQCTRGIEGTTAVDHADNASVLENNIMIYYHKLHFPINTTDGDVIPPSTLNRDMEICDEHIEVICDYTAYKLLLTVDNERAQRYAISYGKDIDRWLDAERDYIKSTRNAVTGTINITPPMYFEGPMTPYRNW